MSRVQPREQVRARLSWSRGPRPSMKSPWVVAAEAAAAEAEAVEAAAVRSWRRPWSDLPPSLRQQAEGR
jgi:hypothetical protein